MTEHATIRRWIPRAFAMLLVLAAGGGGDITREISFQQRVEAQDAIKRVYYSHQIDARRTFEEAVPP